jgi:ankyrin repeat protein
MLAANLGHRGIVELLLNRGANVFAATYVLGYVDRGVSELRTIEANAFVTRGTNKTALVLAAEGGYGNEGIVEMLLDRGGTKLLEMATIEGRTPLLAAASKGHALVVGLLLDKGANINAMEWIPDDSPTPGKLKISAFSLAARQGHLVALNVLLSRLSKAKFENDYGCQALHYAAQYGHIFVIKQLLKDYIGLLNSRGALGETAISIALRNGNMDVFLYLFKRGADMSTKGNTSDTLLFQAVRRAHLQAVDMILTKGPSLLDVRNNAGQTAIFAALENDHLEIFEYLFLPCLLFVALGTV